MLAGNGATSPTRLFHAGIVWVSVLALLLKSAIAPGAELSGRSAQTTLTYIEVTVTARGHAAGVLRDHANALREHQASPGQITVMQEISRPERFLVLERDRPTVLTTTKADTHALTDGLTDDLTAPPEIRLDHELDESGTPPTPQLDARANFYVVAHMDIASPDRAGIETSLHKLAAAARRSDGNSGFEILQQTDHPNHYNLVSAWLGESPFRAFAASATAREFRLTIAPLLGSPYDERLFRRVD
jgi:quinol monooxygenase YgiN